MAIPDRPTFTERSHGNLGNGGYAYHLVCVEDPELHVDIRRPAKHAETISYRHALLPDMVFRTPAEVRDQVAALTAEQAAAQRATFPKFECNRHSKDWGVRAPVPCSMCRTVGLEPASTYYFTTRLSWVPGHTRNYANLCDAHALLPLGKLDSLLTQMTEDRLSRRGHSTLLKATP